MHMCMCMHMHMSHVHVPPRCPGAHLHGGAERGQDARATGTPRDVEKNYLVLTYRSIHLLTYSLTHYFYALLTGAPGLRAKLRRRLPGAMRARGRLPAGAALLPVHPRQGLGSAPDSEQHLLRPRSVPSQLATPKMARDVYCLGSYPLSGDFGPPPGPNFLHPPTEYL